jgi:hypothetical protein
MKTTSAANHALTRVSILILAAGALCMGLATTLPAFIIGILRLDELSATLAN